MTAAKIWRLMSMNNDDGVFQPTQITHTHPDFPSQTKLAYNANGCLTRDEEGKTLDHDSHSRLKSVSDGSGRVVSQYDYDTGSRLVSQSISDQPDTRLFYRGDQLIGIVSGEAQTNFLADHLGSWGQSSGYIYSRRRLDTGPESYGPGSLSVAGFLNRPLQFSFGPVGASHGKRQTTGSGALEGLEKKRRMYNVLRDTIRRQARGGSGMGGA